MAEASIPVDLFNPGQVFASLGFLEVADLLIGDAGGGFDWSDWANVRFVLRVAGDENPVAAVLDFLAEAEVHCYAPTGFVDPRADQDLTLSESFPADKGDRMALPVRLEANGRPPIDLDHWADGSKRNRFKLYAGNRSAADIAGAMLRGTRSKSSKQGGTVKTFGVSTLWKDRCDELTESPFDVTTLMGGSFNFDPRGAWTPLDAGYSPNQHKYHGVAASPLVEILAALGLQHARPDEYRTRHVRYGAWGGLVPPILARPALAGVGVAVPLRRFRFVLDLSGKNKVVTFAQEEIDE